MYRYPRSTSQRRFSHIHVDLVGPLPASKGFTYLFTIMDRTSRWPEAIPLRPRTASPAAVRWSQRRHPPLPPPLHAAHRRQGGQGVYPQTHALHRSCSAARASQGLGPPARRCPLPGFPAAGGRRSPPGALRPRATSRTAPGTVFPWHTARGFCTPRRRSRPHRRSARSPPPSAVKIRPLGLRPRGLGEPCRGSPRVDLQGLRICYAASLQYTLHSHVLYTHVFCPLA